MAQINVDTQDIRNHHLFSILPEETFKALTDKSRLQKLRKGEFLFQQNDDANNFFYVLKGTIKLYRIMLDGTEKIIELVPAGQSFGEALVFTSAPKYPVTAQAVEAGTQVVCFPNADYLTLLKANPNLTLQLLSGVTTRLRMRLNEIELLSLKNATHRVVRYLITLMSEYTEPNPSFKLPAAKRLIAGHLGIRPETFSRVVAKLKEEHIIAISGSVITVLDRQALLRYE